MTIKTQKSRLQQQVDPNYRFQTMVQDGIEAVVKIKCFLRQPNTKCTIIRPMTFYKGHLT